MRVKRQIPSGKKTSISKKRVTTITMKSHEPQTANQWLLNQPHTGGQPQKKHHAAAKTTGASRIPAAPPEEIAAIVPTTVTRAVKTHTPVMRRRAFGISLRASSRRHPGQQVPNSSPM